VTASNSPRPAPLARTYEGWTTTLRDVRGDLLSWLSSGQADDDACERAALVVSELAANAVQAAPGRRYEVEALWDGAHVVMTVRNRSDGDRPPQRSSWGPVDALAPRGRGLAIVDALADAVQVTERDGTVVVTARLRVATASDGNGQR
jgi:anti-sigma regulatory factor (Ser/Thr protein kinase)